MPEETPVDDPEQPSPFALPDEYAILADPQRVMREVVALLSDLHRATLRFGDALESVGLPARMWRSNDAWLDLLSERLPALTLDEYLARLARFAADKSLRLLHGDERDIAAFGELIDEWGEQAQTLRVVANRLRLAGAHGRQGQPLAEALVKPRLNAPLDRLIALLNDLKSLQPFLVPLTQREWETLDLSDALDDMPPDTLTYLRGNSPAAHAHEEAQAAHDVNAQAPALRNEEEAIRPLTPDETRQQSQSFRRLLRDFAPPPMTAEPSQTPAPAETDVSRSPTLRLADERLIAALPGRLHAPARWVLAHRLIVTILVILALAIGLGIVNYLAHAYVGR